MLEIFIPNAISWYFYPSPTSMGLGVFILIYLLFRDGMGGQSIAKKLLGLMVIDTSTGQPCGPLKSFHRNLILVVPFSPLVELIAMFAFQDGRRLGDRLAGTQVIPLQRANK